MLNFKRIQQLRRNHSEVERWRPFFWMIRNNLYTGTQETIPDWWCSSWLARAHGIFIMFILVLPELNAVPAGAVAEECVGWTSASELQAQCFSQFHKRPFLRCAPTQLSCLRAICKWFWCCACTWLASVNACCVAEGHEERCNTAAKLNGTLQVKGHTCKKAWAVPPPFMQKQPPGGHGFSLWMAIAQVQKYSFFFFSCPDSTSPIKACCTIQCIVHPSHSQMQLATWTRDTRSVKNPLLHHSQLSSRVHLPWGGCDGAASPGHCSW